MLIHFEHRPSDSPVVERVWRSHSERAGQFHSMATSNWVMVVSRHQGRIFLTVRGPETQASTADCPAEGEWVGIHFSLGSFMPLLPPGELRDRNGLTLPGATRRAFQLDGSAWEYPGYDNADTFVNRLVKKGLVVTDRRVVDTLQDRPDPRSPRSGQRDVLRATGMTQAGIRQVQRARRATLLLQGGAPTLQVAHDLGYYDQAHLTRSMKHYVGQTPGQIARGEAQLSLLYKTGDS